MHNARHMDTADPSTLAIAASCRTNASSANCNDGRMKVRTIPMKWADKERGQYPCAYCGRPTRRDFAVHVIDGGSTVLHPEDEPLYQSDDGDMGLHFVGPECRKRFGTFAVAMKEG